MTIRNKPAVPAALLSGVRSSIRNMPSVPEGLLSSVRSEADEMSRSEQRQVSRMLGEVKNEVLRVSESLKDRVETLETRQLDLEQSAASRRRISSGGASASWGETVVESDSYRAFVANSCKGRVKIPVSNAITSATGSGGALVRPDRDANGVTLPRRRLLVRALLGQGRTGSNLVEYFREKTFTNNANVVSEGGLKPESVLEYELENAPVRTIAHWIPASRQVMDDAPQLGTLIDTSLVYGLNIKEEAELLYGDGTGEHLYGMIPQATAFEISRIEALDTRIDVLRHAISQAEEADLPASGVILNTRDWLSILGTKDTTGDYISNGPWSGGPGTIWGLPVVWTNGIDVGDFLVGAFETATQIYDRMDPEVLVSDEDRDNFIKNMLTVRAEKRLAFAVKRPAALIHGSFDDIPVSGT